MRAVWVLADLHLAFGNPGKNMEVFGPAWKGYADKIEKNWKELVGENDLVLIPGDISWAMQLKDALTDLEWIDRLPGEKLLIRGNHDYWWPSSTKLKASLPPTIHFIHNDSFDWEDISFAGARLWDTPEFSFDSYIEFVENPYSKVRGQEELEAKLANDEKIFERELHRLEMSLERLKPDAKTKIALTHYPPIGPELHFSRASSLLEAYGIDICVFGHLHNVRENSLSFGTIRGVRYIFASADYLDFTPLKILK